MALASWALSSPVGSSPDDDFHQVSIWCSHGERDGLCEKAPSANKRMVPPALVTTSCYAHKPKTTGACSAHALSVSSHELIATKRGNFGANAGLYPPVYYAVMGTFASQNIVASVLTIRLLNSLLYTALMTLLCALLPAHRRPTLILASAITLIPLGVFLIASINPSSWAIMSAAILPLSLVGYFETTGRRRICLAALALLAALMGGGARSDMAFYSILTVVAAIILFARRDRHFWKSAAWPLGIAVVSLYFMLSARQSSGALDPSDAVAGLGRLLDNAFALPVMWAGALGAPSPLEPWGLGWADTAMPATVWMSTLVVFSIVIFASAASTSGRQRFVVASAFAALWAIPLYIIESWGVRTGQWVQPRYILPLLTIFAAFALLKKPADRSVAPSFSRGQIWACSGALGLAHSVALFVNIRRYTHGARSLAIDLGNKPTWWWDGWIPSPLFIWAMGTLAFAAMIVLLLRAAAPATPVIPATSDS